MSLLPSPNLPKLDIGGIKAQPSSPAGFDVTDIVSYVNQPSARALDDAKPAATKQETTDIDRRIASIDDALSQDLPAGVEAGLKSDRTALEGERKQLAAPLEVRERVDTAMRKIEAGRLSQDGIQVARAEIRQSSSGAMIDIMPEDDLMKGLPNVSIPNNVGAEGFGRDMWQHDYLIVTDAPRNLNGPEALKGVGDALKNNPAPGDSKRASLEGTLNDVGDIAPLDGDSNNVRSYVIKSDQPNRTDIVVNYTVDGQHILDEGFVMRYGEMMPDGSIRIVTYGEGDALPQVEALEGLMWGAAAEEIWNGNAQEIFDQAVSAQQ